MNREHATTVVVGVDGSRDGDRAVAYATALACREDLDVRLVHVAHDYPMYGPTAPAVPQVMAREIGEGVLRSAADVAVRTGLPGDRLTEVLEHGPRAAALVSHLGDAAFVVLGSRRSALQHLLTGHTSLAVVARSSVPVHCVPPDWSPTRRPFGRIAAGVDGSSADLAVLDESFERAASARAALEVVHAWRPVSPYDVAVTGRVLRNDWQETVREVLCRAVDPVAAEHPGVRWTLRLDYDRVPVALHDAATRADLLVLGRHGHHAAASLAVGSNTRTLLRSASCPVEVVGVSSPPGRRRRS